MISSRRGHEGPPDGEHLPLAAAQGAGDLVLALLQDREPLVHPLQAARPRCACCGARPGAGCPARSWRRTPRGPPAPGRCRRGRCGPRGRPVMARPWKRDLPRRGVLMPSAVSRSVVLPAPLAPIRTTISPAAHLQAAPAQGVHVPVGHRQIPELEAGGVTRCQGRPPAPGVLLHLFRHALRDLLAEVEHRHRSRTGSSASSRRGSPPRP